MKALSKRIQKPYKGEIVLVLKAVILSKVIFLTILAVILSKNYFSEPNSFMHMFNVSTLYRQSIK